MTEGSIHDPERVRALLFDLGGVVIGFDFGRAFRLWAARAECDPALVVERFSLDKAYEQHERGEIEASEYFASLRQSLEINISDGDFIEGWNDVYLGPVRGIAEVLSRAQERFPIYAFTNSNPTHKAVWEVRYADELKPFRSIFVSSDLGCRKPDPEAFRLVASRMGFQPHQILFFDDTPGNVVGARMTGMEGVVVESAKDVRQVLSRLGVELDQ